jgi:hypothetical protein
MAVTNKDNEDIEKSAERTKDKSEAADLSKSNSLPVDLTKSQKIQNFGPETSGKSLKEQTENRSFLTRKVESGGLSRSFEPEGKETKVETKRNSPCREKIPIWTPMPIPDSFSLLA